LTADVSVRSANPAIPHIASLSIPLRRWQAGRSACREAEIRAQHPYELPEIVAVSIERGLAGYLAWVAEETSPTP
jgi:periplasmic divalent cation tolerance protein